MRTYIRYTLFIWLLSTVLLYGQGWEKVYGGEIYSQALAVFPTSTGNYLVEGLEVDAVSEELEHYILMLDASGALLWENNAPSTGAIASEIVEYPDGTFARKSYRNVIINSQEYRKVEIIRMNPLGQTLWTYTPYASTEMDTDIRGIFINPDNSLVFFDQLDDTFTRMTRLSENGVLLSQETTQIPSDNFYSVDRQGGHFVFSKVSNDGQSNTLLINRADEFGDLVSSQTFPDLYEGGTGRRFILEDGDWMVIQSPFNSSEINQIRINIPEGTVETAILWTESDPMLGTLDVALLEDGLIIANYHPDEESVLLMRSNLQGDLLWSKLYNHHPADVFPQTVNATLDGGFIVGGEYQQGLTSSIVFRTDGDGLLYPNIITGRVALDTSGNCLVEPAEEALEDWLVAATKSGNTFIATTNELGEYILPADTGVYRVRLIKPSENWASCQDEVELTFDLNDTSANIDFPVDIEIECPNLAISHTVPAIRPCFERPSYVNYCNYGTETAVDAYIDIVYDSLIRPVNASIDFDSLGEQVYRFELGDIEPLECGEFRVDLFLDCEAVVGASYCIEAHAFPDTLCTPPAATWSGAFIEVSAVCEQDSVYFRIENTGSGNMEIDEYSKFIIVEDIILLKRDSVSFDSGQFDTIPFPANGSTYAMVAEQVEDAPGFSYPMAIVEGCGENDEGEFSIGYSQQFPLNDANPFLDIDCPIAISSFDPNDKQGFPVGYQEEHFIQLNTPIEYLVRFQNTGTDTAFTVIIRDTLDTNLDIASLQVGASSHSFDFDVTGEGVLVFNFQNIMLPDSNVNQLASNGFIEYKITPKTEAELGTVIRNRAAIYFDFNEPVITNETFHTLGIDFVEFIVGTTQYPTRSNIAIVVRPNPFDQQTEILIENHSEDNYFLEIFDINGKLIRSEQHNGSVITFYRKNLVNGLYFYRLSASDGFLNTGKIIIGNK